MSRKAPKLMSLAAALAGLTGTAAVLSDQAAAKTPDPQSADPAGAAVDNGLVPNRIVSTGKDLLGFTVTKAPGGTVLAQHSSHVSHASHSSHTSHYSSSR